MKRIAAIVSVIMLTAAALCCFAQADSAVDGQVVQNVSPFMLEHCTDLALNSFNDTNEGWDSDQAGVNVTLAQSIDAFPYTPLTGNGSLIVRAKDDLNSNKIIISKEYDTPLDLSRYNSLIFGINCSKTEGSSPAFVVEIYTDGDVFTESHTVSPMGWNGVFVDLSDWEARSEIKRIKLSLVLSAPAKGGFEYYVDSIGVSKRANAYIAARFCADGYTAKGGELTVGNGVMTVSGVKDELTLQSNGFLFSDPAEANSLKLEFGCEGMCTSVMLSAQSPDGLLLGESYADLAANTGIITAFLALPKGTVGKITLTLEGVDMGKTEIYSIQPASMPVPAKSGTGSIDTCAINSSTNEILIKGTVGKENFEGFSQKDIYLFSFDLNESISVDTLKAKDSLTKSVVTGESFIFRVKFKAYTDGRQLLYRKYAVAVKSEYGFKIIGTPMCVTNPEGYTESTPAITLRGSGKGVYNESVAFMQEMGVSDTVIWVDIGKFFLQESGAGSKFECGGTVYYYNTEYVETICNMIKNFSEKNINVTLILVVSDTGNETLNRILIHKDADLGATYCAYNTADRSGLMYLRAVSEFFAKRYGKTNEVTRVVFGDSVANAKEYYNMGEKPLTEFASEYAKGLRTVYNAFRSYSASTRIYTYIDDNWDKDLPFDMYTRYDGRMFIDALNGCISEYGDINWGVALNPYPEGTADYFSYTDNTLDGTPDADRLSFKNIRVLCDRLAAADLLYNGSDRDIMIIEKTEFDRLDEMSITADYVYNCYKALNTAVSAYITDRNCNHNDAMKHIDTSLSLTASSFVPDVLGVATWESVIEGFSEDNIVKRKIQNGEFSVTAPDEKGSLPLSDFDKDSDGWTRYAFTERLTSGSTFLDREHLLSVYPGALSNGETKGIVKEFSSPKDLSLTPIIHFGINVASLPANVNFASVSVMLVSGNNSIELSGSVKESTWVDVYCDFSSFSGISAVDEIKILFHATENYYDSPQLLITAIRGISTRYDTDQLNELTDPVPKQERMMENIKKYAYPALIGVILVSLTVLIRRRTAKKK